MNEKEQTQKVLKSNTYCKIPIRHLSEAWHQTHAKKHNLKYLHYHDLLDILSINHRGDRLCPRYQHIAFQVSLHLVVLLFCVTHLCVNMCHLARKVLSFPLFLLNVKPFKSGCNRRQNLIGQNVFLAMKNNN